MRNVFYNRGNRAVEILLAAAVIWSTLALGAAWGWGFAVTFGLLAAAFCLWAGMRLLADAHCERSGGGQTVSQSGRPAPSNSAAANLNTQRAEKDRRQHHSPNAPLLRDAAPPLRVDSRLACVLIAALAAYLILQILPLPAELVAVLSPERAAQDRWLATARQDSPARMLTLALDADASRRALALVGAAVMAFVAGAYLAASRKRVRRTLQVLIILVLVEAIYGLVENLTGHNHIYWLPVEGDFARGTFFNRNHFAATLSLFLPVTIGWFFFRAAAAKSSFEKGRGLPATSWDILGTRQGLWVLAPAVLVLGVIQSQSRAGFACMLLGAALMFAIGARRRPMRVAAWLSIPLALVVFAWGIESDYQIVLDRFGDLARDIRAEGRLAIWRDSLGIVRDYPLAGVGLGNFPRIYMQYASGDTLIYPYQAHNEWLEGLITLGAIGMGLVVPAAAVFYVHTFRRIRRARADQPWLLGCWCGLVALAAHSFGEFNLHIPSIAITAALLAGILVGFEPPRNPSSSSYRRISETRATELCNV